MKCKTCKGECKKDGKQSNGIQKYRCKKCGRYQQSKYRSQVNNEQLKAFLKEGLGIRSISRLMSISPSTVIRKVITIAAQIEQPKLTIGQEYEVDELCTYIGNKNRKRWVAYSLRRDTKTVVNFAIGSRTKKTIIQVIDTLLLSQAKMIYTDKLNIYRSIIPIKIHQTKKYSINHIERKNLSLRTHLKRLNRRTICYSKSLLMLSACLKIYFWG